MNLSLHRIFNILEKKSIVIRERKPKEVVFFGLLLYFKGLIARQPLQNMVRDFCF